MPSSGPTHEVRLGVVMYGGVSLAVYMSGVARELFNLVHASRVEHVAAAPSSGASRAPDSEAVDAPGDTAPSGTAAGARSGAAHTAPGDSLTDVYRALIAAMDQGLGSAGGASRVSIDVIVGASAGGINGVYLAKALAAGAPASAFDALRRLWFEQADITTLVDGLGPRPQVVSLFDGAFMFTRLREALDAVDDAADSATRGDLAEQLALVVTATDLGGVPVRIRLADRVAEERNHKQAFAFRRDRRGRDDFGPDANALLAFAARTTSSFPVAFAPTRVYDVLQRGDAGTDAPWWRLFRRLRDPAAPAHLKRVFADGGYLDNKPFGHAIDQLGATSAGRRVTRKLLYVEPNPELDVRSDVIEPPDAVTNALSAFTLARYETIRDDLAHLTERNRLVDRLRTLTAGLEEDVARLGRTLQPVGRDPLYGQRDLAALVRDSGLGPGYGAYHRLRVATTTDHLADLVADHAAVPAESDHRLALRELVQRWRVERFARNPGAGAARSKRPESAFLDAFDVAFRIRRARFVLAKLGHLAQLTPETVTMLEHYRTMPDFEAIDDVLGRYESGADGIASARAAWATVAAALADARERCQAALDRLQARLAPPAAGTATGAQPATSLIAQLDRPAAASQFEAELDAILQAHAEGTSLPSRAGATPAAPTRLEAAIEALVPPEVAAFDTSFDAAFDAAMGATTDALGPSGDQALIQQVSTLARTFYSEGFELYDAIEFPLVEASGLVGERAPVEVYRVSPADATLLFETPDQGHVVGAPGVSSPVADARTDRDAARDRARDGKLFGLRLGSFGAFFDRRWRQNDLLWGRLDGAERLIASLLPGAAHAERRRALSLAAARAIVREELPQLDPAEVETLDAQGLLAVIQAAHPRDQAPAAAAVAQDTAHVARTATALLRHLVPTMAGTNAILRSLGGLFLVLLWAVKARPWALTALTLVTLALAFAVAYATRLTLASAVASAVTIAALLAAGGVMVAWFFRRRLLGWLGAQLGSRDA